MQSKYVFVKWVTGLPKRERLGLTGLASLMVACASPATGSAVTTPPPRPPQRAEASEGAPGLVLPPLDEGSGNAASPASSAAAASLYLLRDGHDLRTDYRIVLMAHTRTSGAGRHVQIYECARSATDGRFAWTNRAPRVDEFDVVGLAAPSALSMHHFRNRDALTKDAESVLGAYRDARVPPNQVAWQIAIEDPKAPFLATITATLEAQAPRTDAIPLFRLARAAEAFSPETPEARRVDDALFGKVAYVLRLGTRGGMAPARPCVEANAGELAESNYEADYYFMAPR